MIGTVYGRVGESVELSGYADDFERPIEAVQFSLNDGKTWTDYPCAGSDAERLLRWRFEFVPKQEGSYRLLVRSKNDLGETSPTPARVQICVEA